MRAAEHHWGRELGEAEAAHRDQCHRGDLPGLPPDQVTGHPVAIGGSRQQGRGELPQVTFVDLSLVNADGDVVDGWDAEVGGHGAAPCPGRGRPRPASPPTARPGRGRNHRPSHR